MPALVDPHKAEGRALPDLAVHDAITGGQIDITSIFEAWRANFIRYNFPSQPGRKN